MTVAADFDPAIRLIGNVDGTPLRGVLKSRLASRSPPLPADDSSVLSRRVEVP